MAAIKFELEQVLKYRAEIERLKKEEFSVAKQHLESAEDILQYAKERRVLISKEFKAEQTKLKTIDELNRYAAFFDKQREDIKRQKEEIIKLDKILDEKRGDLLEATKDKKALESLKEKKAKEFRAEMALKERNFLDEIAIQKERR